MEPATAPPGSQLIPFTEDDIKRITNMFRFLIELADKKQMAVDEELRKNALNRETGLNESISRVLMLAVWIKNKDTSHTLESMLRQLPEAPDRAEAIMLDIKNHAVASGKLVLDELCGALPGTLGAETKQNVAPWIKIAEEGLEPADNLKLCKYVAWILTKVYFSNV